MKKSFALILAAIAAMRLYAKLEITDVKAEPMSPWGKVAITYTLSETIAFSETSGVYYYEGDNSVLFIEGILIAVLNPMADEVNYATSSCLSGISYKKGTHTVVWDMRKDNVFIDNAEVDFRVFVKVSGKGIQLWEDGPYWAEHNIGATIPEEFGYYFWWGDTVGYRLVNDLSWNAVDGSKTGFSFERGNCPTYGLDAYSLYDMRYVTFYSAFRGVLTDEYDAAKQHWGENWRMPTASEFAGFITNCITTWTTQRAVRGLLVKGKGAYASKSIFRNYCKL